MKNNRQQNDEEKEDWLGKLVCWLVIGGIVFGITTFFGYLDDKFVFRGDNTFYIELLILIAIVVLLSLGGLFRKK